MFFLAPGSPSPAKRNSDNELASQRRETERQQILQRLVASQTQRTERPPETIYLTPMAAEFRNVGRPDADDCSTDTEWNQSETAMNSQTQIDLKAEKKVSHSASSIKLIELISLFSTLLRLFELFATLFNSLRF